jgi:membrane protein
MNDPSGVKSPTSDKPVSADPDAARAKSNLPVNKAKMEPERGREATTPTEFPQKGWKDIFWRTTKQLSEDNLSIVAAGVAFYAFVAVVPTIAATIGLYALIADPGTVAGHLNLLARVVPGQIMPLLEEQVKRIASDNTAAGWSAVVGLLIALYSSASATKALITGLNVAYDQQEKRSFIKLNLIAFVLTVAAIVGVLANLALVTVLPKALEFLGLSGGAKTALAWLRWPVIVGLFMTALAVIYRFGPCRKKAQWRWVSWGAALATLLWVAGSALFSLYVTKFGGYDKTYGSLGAVVIFLLWLFLTAYAVLVGAEFNGEMERQTLKDTTEGQPKPIGTRGAYAADTVGPSKSKSGAPKSEDV